MAAMSFLGLCGGDRASKIQETLWKWTLCLAGGWETENEGKLGS